MKTNTVVVVVVVVVAFLHITRVVSMNSSMLYFRYSRYLASHFVRKKDLEDALVWQTVDSLFFL